MDDLVLFFPTSLVFIGIGSSQGWWAVIIVAVGCLANVALYVFAGWIILSLVSLFSKFVSR